MNFIALENPLKYFPFWEYIAMFAPKMSEVNWLSILLSLFVMMLQRKRSISYKQSYYFGIVGKANEDVYIVEDVSET